MPYLHDIQPTETDEQLVSLRMLATQEDIPIITQEGIRFLAQIGKLIQAKDVLELGTAIGYTSIYLAKTLSCHVTTIERDLDMISLARSHIKASGVASHIRLLEDDALLVDPTTIGPFDLMFIDAAKAQSEHLFRKYQSRLRKGGVIVIDNLSFHGLHGKDDHSRPLTRLIGKIDSLNRFLLAQSDFDTTLHNIGDGMSVSIRKEE